MLLVLDKEIDAVESNAAVIADNSASALSVGQSRNDRGLSRKAHLGSIRVENALIMGLSVLCEDLNDLRIDLVAIVFAGFLSHSDSAEGL